MANEVAVPAHFEIEVRDLARGDRLALHKFAGQPHTFIMGDPASEASRRATELIRDFVLQQAGQASPS